MPSATVSTARPGIDFKVGTSIPPATPHAVSVSLPKWQDNVDYEEGRLADVMQTGYPRFFIHRSIQKLAAVLLARFGQRGASETAESEACILVPSKRVADGCRSFLQDHHARQTQSTTPLPVRSVQVCLTLPSSSSEDDGSQSMASSISSLPPQGESASAFDDCASAKAKLSIYIVLFPQSAFPLAKSFWQHTGDGISSRMAEAYLTLLEQSGRLDGNSNGTGNGIGSGDAAKAGNGAVVAATNGTARDTRSYARNRHYSRANSAASLHASAVLASPLSPASSSSVAPPQVVASTSALDEDTADGLGVDHATYLEERYGRNMARIEAPRAKLALRKRIAGVASNDVLSATEDEQRTDGDAAKQAVSADVQSRSTTTEKAGYVELTERDVYLYPTGMSAIFHAHQLALRHKSAKSVCFGFPYLDTLKILEKWGPGCHFLGHGDASDLARLGEMLKSGERITSLFCEFPSNPLLRSPDLPALRRLADEYDFLIVVDETIGNFVNVEVLPYADVVVSSLTKIFTGEANGMGGSLVLNVNGKQYARLRALQDDEYEDNFFDQNAIFLERNSRDFAQRVRRIDGNAEALVERLCVAQQGAFSHVLKRIYYPTLVSRAQYEACKRAHGGYGGLFSLTFHSMRAAVAFYDALHCAKGPSLGTNFTLASPFVILAHYTELDWAAQFGVEANLVRVSVGLEERESLFAMFDKALQEASAALALADK